MLQRLLLFCFILAFSNVFSQDLYDLNSIKEVRLNFEQDNWFELLNDLKDAGEDGRLLARLTLDGVQYDSVGVRYKGNSSFHNVRKSESSKLPFNVKVNYVRKEQILPGGYKTLKLSNVFRDPSFLREVVAYEVVRDYMPAPRANYALVYVNDKKLGLYNLTESVDKAFLQKHFDYAKGFLFKCDPTWDAQSINGCPKGEKASLIYQGTDSLCYMGNYELKSKCGWSDLIRLTRVLEKSPEKIEAMLNVDQVLWMHAFNNVVVNLDSYTGRLCHNYYLYEDSFGIFQPIVWDMNLSFGGFRFDGNKPSPMSNEDMQKMGLFLHYRNDFRPLISKLLKNSLNRKIYVAHVKTILEEQFLSGKFNDRTIELQKQIDSYVKNDENKLYAYESFTGNLTQTAMAGKSKIIGLRELMDARQVHLQEHPLLKKETPVIRDVEHLSEDNKLIIRAKLEKEKNVYLAYRYEPFAPFTRIALFDDGTHDDMQAGDGIYGVAIEKKEMCQYYIIAENDRTASLSPQKAAYEFYEFKSSLQASQ